MKFLTFNVVSVPLSPISGMNRHSVSSPFSLGASPFPSQTHPMPPTKYFFCNFMFPYHKLIFFCVMQYLGFDWRSLSHKHLVDEPHPWQWRASDCSSVQFSPEIHFILLLLYLSGLTLSNILLLVHT